MTKSSRPSTAAPRPSPISAFPRALLWVGAGLLLWIVLSEATTQAWYAWKESQVPRTEPWVVAWPTEKDAASRGFLAFQNREMSDSEKELLRFRSGQAAGWRDASGVQ